MMIFRLIIVCTGVAATIGVVQAYWNPFDMMLVMDYNKINKHLEKNVHSDDVGDNLSGAIDWYAREWDNKHEGSFARALKQFTKLATILNPDQCSYSGYATLKAADIATQGGAISLGPKRRIDQLIKRRAVDHAEYCYKIYPGLIATEANDKMSKEVHETVSELRDETLAVVRNDVSELELEKCGELDPFFEEKILNSIPIYSVLSQAVSGTSDADYLKKEAVDEKKLKELFNKHILNHCETYNNQVSDKFYEVIKFDLKTVHRVGAVPKCDNVVDALHAMTVCRNLVHNKKVRNAAFEGLLQAVKRS